MVHCEIPHLIYGDFMVPGADPKLYSEITDTAKMVSVVEEYLDDYNATNTKKMPLVMFVDAVGHVARISRVIRQPLGNALLLGVGGSGRQSLSRLAAAMAEFDCFQIEITKTYGKAEWKDDLKKLLLKTGEEGKQLVFLFTDTQIVKESFLEDVNNILNTGEVPNLLDDNDVGAIINVDAPDRAGARPAADQGGALQHLRRPRARQPPPVLCMSPLGEAFRTRLRNFPSLVNNCTIDFFAEWPEEALRSVAKNTLDTIDMGDDQTRRASSRCAADPPVGRACECALPRGAAAVQLRDADVLPGGAVDVQDAACAEARGGGHRQAAAGHRPRQAAGHRGRGRAAQEADRARCSRSSSRRRRRCRR